MKKSVLLIVFIFFSGAGLCFAAPSTPSDFKLSSDERHITATWTANNDGVAGYTIYWGESSSDLTTEEDIDDPVTESFRIENLQPETYYYAAIVAYDSAGEESARSSTLSARTLSEKPDTPTGLAVVSAESITDSTVSLEWDENDEEDVVSYQIEYRTASTDSKTISTGNISYMLADLDMSARHYIKIAAVDSSGNVSNYTSELVVDTTPDTNRPYTPSNVQAEMVGQDIEITFNQNNDWMADFTGCRVYYGTSSGSYTDFADVGEKESYVFDNFAKDVTYYFAVRAYDHNGNESYNSGEVSEHLETTRTLLGETGSFGGGCFVGSSGGFPVAGFIAFFSFVFITVFCVYAKRMKHVGAAALIFILATATGAFCEEPVRNNLAGAKIGYFEPSDEAHNDIYDDNPFPFYVFYERTFLKHLSVDFELGYSRRKGYSITGSGESTTMETKLTLVPFSTALKWNFEVTPLVFVYVGAGADYWYYKEESDSGTYDAADDDYGVGGYHIEMGGKFLSGDREYYKKYGLLVETVYSVVDRFDANETDLGGWNFNIGAFCMF